VPVQHDAQKFNSRLEVVCFPQEEFDVDGGALARQIKAAKRSAEIARQPIRRPKVGCKCKFIQKERPLL